MPGARLHWLKSRKGEEGRKTPRTTFLRSRNSWRIPLPLGGNSRRIAAVLRYLSPSCPVFQNLFAGWLNNCSNYLIITRMIMLVKNRGVRVLARWQRHTSSPFPSRGWVFAREERPLAKTLPQQVSLRRFCCAEPRSSKQADFSHIQGDHHVRHQAQVLRSRSGQE
jgi:hypothetical protein